MLTDIRALADHFLIALPNINTPDHDRFLSNHLRNPLITALTVTIFT